MKMSICRKFRFDAAHYLPNYEGKCKNVHGHSWTLEVEVTSILARVLIQEGPKQGMVADFVDLNSVVQGKVIDILDHRLLNDVIPNPTAENILLWVRDKLYFIPLGELTRLRLYETPESFAELKL